MCLCWTVHTGASNLITEHAGPNSPHHTGRALRIWKLILGLLHLVVLDSAPAFLLFTSLSDHIGLADVMNFLGDTVVQILNASFVEGIVRNFETILPVQAIFLPLAAAITGEKANLSEPWLYLLFIHWLGSVLHSLWTFANPFHCLLYLVRIDSIHSQGDPSYDWLLHYWINHPSHARKRTFNTLSRSASAVNMNNPMPFIRGADGERGLLHTGERASKIAFAHPPRDNETVWFFRDGVLFRLSASSGFEKIHGQMLCEV